MRGVRILILIGFLLNCSPNARAEAIGEFAAGRIAAVFVVSGITGDESLALDRVELFKLGRSTYPPVREVQSTLSKLKCDLPMRQLALIDEVDFVSVFYTPPNDFGSIAAVDRHTGTVLFAGSMVWGGRGTVYVPRDLLVVEPRRVTELCPSPNRVAVLRSPYWNSEARLAAEFGTSQEITNEVLEYLRGLEPFVEFAAHGIYEVASLVYTPIVGRVSPWAAKCVIFATTN